MNEFPHVPLSLYTAEDGRDRSEGMKRFANDLKAWLKSANLDLDFLSLNLGKSLGTVRNWMTGNINVADSKLAKILEVCQAHAAGGRGVIYQKEASAGAIDYIWVRPYMVVKHSPDASSVTARENEVLQPIHVPHGRYRQLYEKWCAAARVPEDTLFNLKALYYPPLAQWVTDVIMGATREALEKAAKEKKLNVNALPVGDELPDLGAVLRGAPCVCSFFAGGKLTQEGVWEKDSSLMREDICFFLPVLRDVWRGDFIRLAASFSSHQHTDLWMLEHLNKAALKLLGRDLSDFITYRYKSSGK